MNKCPCENCLLVSICRNKTYLQLVKECSLLKVYLYKKNEITLSTRKINFHEKAKITISILKAKCWCIREDLSAIVNVTNIQ